MKIRESHIWKIAGAAARRKQWQSLGMLLAVAGATLTALFPPLVLERVINALSEQSTVGTTLLSLALGYLLIMAVSGALESLQNILITQMGQSITHEMRSVMSAKLSRLPAEYFTKNETGRITSRFVNDVDAVDSLFTNGIISMFADAFKMISILIIIFVKSRGLGILMCLVTPLLFYMTLVFQKRMRSAQMENRKAVARVNHHVPETIQNIRMIHTFSGEGFMEEKYASYIEDGYKAMDRSNFYDSVYSPIVIFASSLMIAVMMVCASSGAAMQQLFGISVGSAVAIIAYVGKVFDPLESLGMEIQNIQSALAGVERMDEFLNEAEIVKNVSVSGGEAATATGSEQKMSPGGGCCFTSERKTKTSNAPEKQKDEIRFDHVSFGYGDGREIFTDLNLQIQSGETVVLTGRTGAGKSTLFKLLLGLYRPQSGRVMVGDRLAAQIPEKERRKQFGYVEQHFSVVDGTIRDQVSLLDAAIGDQDVWKALEACGLKSKIEKMPEGMDTRMAVSDFSQGELQLLSIARALAGEPRILLLDEITANLDSLTEKRILGIIRSISKGRTVISISHRLAEQLENVRVIDLGSGGIE